MPTGSCTRWDDLSRAVTAIIEDSRRAALATTGGDGEPHVVPVCFAIVAGEIVTAVDHKPKSGRELARVKNIRARPRVTMLFDRWDEDWTRLGWVMVSGHAGISPPGVGAAELSARYVQYKDQPPAGDVIVVRPDRFRWWLWAAP